MPTNHNRIRSCFRIFINIFILLLLVNSCTPVGSLFSPEANPATPTYKEIQRAEVAFNLTVPIPSEQETSADIFIEILDEVTGLPLHPLRFQMQLIDSTHYTITIPITLGSTIKYRYRSGKEGTLLNSEYTASGKPIRYRMAVITSPVAFSDTIYSWSPEPLITDFGRVVGIVKDSQTDAPLSDILVITAGQQTLTASDGSFRIENVPTGTHNLTAYSLTGKYQTFQQDATVAVNATTPASIPMIAAKYVDLTFIVTPPPGIIPGTPIRILGNTFALGNTFSDLPSGMSTIASRAPIMQVNPDGKYVISLSLPAGLDLRYKYSLGDGFWNSEKYQDGTFRIRQLIIPEHDLTIEDTILAWEAEDITPLNFTLNTPADTLQTDIISIQFKLFGWSPPIPMWPLGNNQWLYTLYIPPQIGKNLEYRYCRNEQCDIAGENQSANNINTRTLPDNDNPIINDEIKSWENWNISNDPTLIASVDIQPRTNSFITGIEFQKDYLPSWQPYLGTALNNINDLNSGWVILAPTWTYSTTNPPILEPVPGADMLLPDLLQTAYMAKDKGLKTAVFPQFHFMNSVADAFWTSATLNDTWWDNWFEQYKRFILNFADFAQTEQVDAIILGGESISPALPSGKLPNGSPSNVPEISELYWEELIEEIRNHFTGTIVWAMPYSEELDTPPNWIDKTDKIYILWSKPIAQSGSTPSQVELSQTVGNLLDTDIKPLYESTGKPILIGIGFPSTTGSASGCIMINEECTHLDTFNSENFQIPSNLINLQEQADIYNAFFVAFNSRSWIGGAVSRDYYPPAALKSGSNSVHGKPAADVIWYWYPRFTGSSN